MKYIKIIVSIYVILLILLYLIQDWVIFRVNPLPDNYTFEFNQAFTEKFYEAKDGTHINTLFFPAEGKSKGLVFNNHGNRRNMSRWGRSARQFTSNGYDVFFYDYRGFGKTKGAPSEEKLHQDAAFLYAEILKKYEEKDIIIYGRSLGTGIATKLASNNKPKMLILESPYYNMANVGSLHLPIFPYSILIKHSFRTDQWIAKVDSPIHIFHGIEDKLIPYKSSLMLVNRIGLPIDSILTTLSGGHRGLSRFSKYQEKMKDLLIQ